jgi:transcription termination/antitermination protein NusG
MKHERGPYSIGDFVGFVEYIERPPVQQDSEKRWRLMQVDGGISRNDATLLRRMQIEIYRPVTRSMRLVARKALSQAQRRNPIKPVREKIELLFPGYAFLSFTETDERWREIFKLIGIRGLVCANNRPVEIPWKMIQQIQAQEVDGAIPSTTKLSAFPFLVGEQVRLTDGPFALFRGTITDLPKEISDVDLGEMTLDQLDESFRVKLLVDIFGRQTPVELGLSQIEKLS